jgi:hypothetical protein
VKTLPKIACVMALPALLGAAGLATRPGGPSIAGTYELTSRDLPDGKQVLPPDLIGMVTFTKDRRNFNVYWQDNGKPVSISAVSRYTLSDKEYTEDNVYYMMNDAPAGKGLSYDTAHASARAPVTVTGDKIQFTLPLHGEPEVVFDKNGFTATRKGAFVDHWKKID